LFQNVTKEGNQASRVLKLANATTAELAILSERELKKVESSPLFKFQKAVEDIKVTLVPLGEAFLKAVTPILEFGTKVLEQFNKLDEGAKSFVVALGAIGGVIGPVFLMGFGLVANGVANLIKMFVFFKTSLNKAASSSTQLGVQTEYMTQQQLEAAAVASSLDQVHQKLRQTFTSEAGAVDALTAAYRRSLAAQGAMSGGVIGRTRVPKKYASGVLSVPGPKGAGDVVPAMLSPGEAVIPARQSRKYSGIIASLISDNVPGFKVGRNPFASMLGRSRVAVRMKDKDFVSSLRQDGKDARYKNAFETQTGADYIRESGSKTTRQRDLRSAMERDVFGLDPKTTSPSSRPTYGYARTPILLSLVNRLFGLKGKNFNSSTTNVGDSLDKYGNIDLITKGSVAKRSSAFAGDALVNYNWATQAGTSRRIPDLDRIIKNTGIRPAPMRGASPEQLKGFERLGSPFGSNRVPGTNSEYWTNPKPAYVETYTPGGFSFKEIDKIIARDPAIAKQLKQELKAAGLGAVRVVGSGFVSRLFKNMGVPGFSNGTKAVTGSTDGKYWLDFLGKRFDLTGPRPKYYADKLPETIETMRATGRSDSSIFERIDDLYKRGIPLRPNKVNNQSTSSGKPHTHAIATPGRSAVETLNKQVVQTGIFDQEMKFLADEAKKLGISESKLKRFFQIEKSHFYSVGDAPKDWFDLSRIAPDNGGLNNYLNRVGGNLGKHLLNKNDDELKSLNIKRKELERLVSGDHPVTRSSAQTLKGIAAYDEKTWSRLSANRGENRHQAILTKRLLDRRLNNNFYGTNLRSYQEFIDQGRIEGRKKQSKAIGGADEKVPSSTRVKGGAASDTRMAAVSPGETILTKKTNRELMAGRPVLIPGFGKLAKVAPGASSNFPRLPGFANGSPEGQFADGTERVYKTEGGQYRDRATKKRLQAKEAKRLMAQDRQNERRRANAAEKRATAEKRSSSIGQSYGMSSKDWDKATRDEQAKLRAQRKQAEAAEKRTREAAKNARIADEQKIAEEKKKLAIKEEKRAERQSKMQGMGGKVAGGVAALGMVGVVGGSMMGGQIGEIANQLMMPVMMLSMMLPMLKNPVALVGIAIAGLVAGFVILQARLNEIRKESAAAARSLSSGKDAMSKFADMAGTVTPSEIMAKRREMEFSPFAVKTGKTTFGQAFVQTDSGKELIQQFEEQTQKFGRSEAIESLQKKLTTAVATGVLSPEQAKSIANSLGQKLKDYGITTNINASIQSILGPDGKVLEGNTIKIYTEFVEGSTSGITGTGGILQSKDFTDNTGTLWWWDTERVAKKEGEAAGIIANFYDENQQLIDAFDAENLKNIDKLYGEGKYDEALAAEEKYQIERKGLVDSYNSQIAALQKDFAAADFDNQQGILSQLAGMAAEVDAKSGEAAKRLQESSAILRTNAFGQSWSASQVRAANNGRLVNPEEIKKEQDFQQVKVKFLGELAAGNIDSETFNGLMKMFDPTTGEGQATLSVLAKISTKVGPQSLGQLETVFATLENPKLAAEISLDIQDKDEKQAKDTIDTLTQLATFDGVAVEPKVVLEFYGKDPDKLEELAEKFNKLKDLENKGMLNVESLVEQKIITAEQGAQFDDFYKDLPPDQKVVYTQVYATQYETILNTPNMIQAWRNKQEPELKNKLSNEQVASILAGEDAELYVETNAGEDSTAVTDPKNTTTGGAKKENPYNSINKSLKELRNNAVNATGGIKELQKWLGKGKDMRPFKGTMNALVAGGTTEEFQDFASNLSKKQQRDLFTVSDGVAKLTGKGKALQKAFNEVSIGGFVIDQQRALANAKNQDIAAKRLIAAGMSTSDAYEAVEDSTLAAAIAQMKLGKKGREELKTIVDSAKKAKNALEGLSPEALSDILKESIDVARDRIQIDFEFKVAGDMGVLRAAESEISALQFQIDDFQAGLQQISWKEDEINKKYDKRSEALDKINTINSQIADQQKGQLSIADALSRGDLSAAAKAIQDFRASEAQRALDGQKNALEAAREKELGAVRSSSGKSRLQLEEDILKKEKEIFKIEEERLEPARERVRLAESARDIAVASLDLQSLGYDDLTNKIKSAELGTVEYQKRLKEALAILQDMAKVKLPMEAPAGQKPTEQFFNLPGKTNTRPGPEIDGKKGDVVTGPKGTTWAWDHKNKEWDKVEKKAFGGYISGAGTSTSDSIPAMLSDGEYVIRASSVNKFGQDFLDDINAGRLPGFKKGGKVGDSNRAAMIADKKKDSAAVSAAIKNNQSKQVLGAVTKAAQILPMISGMSEGIDIGKSLVNLFKGKAGGGDYLTLGLSALGIVPGGKIAKTGSKMMDAIKGFLPASKGTGVKEFSGTPLRNPNASLIKAIVTRRNLHGGGDRKNPQAFKINSEGNPENFFGADFFTTTDKFTAASYKQSAGSIFHASMPISQAAKLKILDLSPGAKSVEEQFPGLYAKLSNSFDVAESGRFKGDHVKKYLNSPNRHDLLAENKEASAILYEHGVRAIRHHQGPVEKMSEVFAFISPQNMRATPIKTRGSKPKKSMGSVVTDKMYRELMLRREFLAALRNPTIVTRRSSGSVDNMLRTGKSMTLFDTGTSAGAAMPDKRAAFEGKYFGDENIGNMMYGYLANKKKLTSRIPFFPKKESVDTFDPFSFGTRQYGDAMIELRQSAMRRASLTAGDSLENFSGMYNAAKGGQSDPKFITNNLGAARKKNLTDFAKKYVPGTDAYIEAQFTKLDPRKDIKAIWMAQEGVMTERLREAIKRHKLNIPVKVPAYGSNASVLGNASSKLKKMSKELKSRFSSFKNNKFNLKDYNPFTNRFGKQKELEMNTLAKGGMVRPQYFAQGGMVKGYAKGGDVVPSMLTPGEFVMKKAAVSSLGEGFLSMLNDGKYQTRGLSEPSFQGIGANPLVNANLVTSNTSVVSDNSSVYNYNLSVNVASMSDPNAIAQTVMGQIRQIDSQRLRGNRF
jgi:hypothetical protein